jgi:hypothetical protein
MIFIICPTSENPFFALLKAMIKGQGSFKSYEKRFPFVPLATRESTFHKEKPLGKEF